MSWLPVLATAAGCFALKAVGWFVPARLLQRPALRDATRLLPLALLAALVVVQVFGSGRSLVVDARAAGLAAAVVALLLRSPFLVVVVAAAVTAAAVRAL